MYVDLFLFSSYCIETTEGHCPELSPGKYIPISERGASRLRTTLKLSTLFSTG
jgi:hypothetical protein